MTPLEKIRQGIETEDMQMVADGYNALSIDEIEYVAKSKEFVERFTSRQVEPPRSKVTSDSQEKRIAKSVPFIVKKRPNLWSDSGEDPPQYSKKDKAIDKKHKK